MSQLVLIMAGANFVSILPPEVIEKYGDLTLSKWKHVVGTGPFMLRDYVGGSAITWVRNPNYWMYDPFFPENQLPYIDTFKLLIIPDHSTRLAAMRTAKIDKLWGIFWEDAESLMKTNPELEWAQYTRGLLPRLQMNNASQPFDDVRVRQALMLAVNHPELVDLFYEGKATLFNYPIPLMPVFSNMYTPLEEMPQSVQELYGYHPDKARQLLAEAGYPDGFQTDILTSVQDADLLSIVKAYWAKIGVDLEIDVREAGAMSALRRTYKQMFMQADPQASFIYFLNTENNIGGNNQNINSPIAQQVRLAVNELSIDLAKRQAILTGPIAEVLPGVPEAQGLQSTWKVYANEQVWFINLPEAYSYTFWQPWVKGFYGAYTAGYYNDRTGTARYLWIDQELKEAMGH